MRHSTLAVLLVLCAAVSSPAQAQLSATPGHWVVGPRFGYDLDTGGIDASEPFFGAQLNWVTGRRWQPGVSVDLYQGHSGSMYRLNADMRYHLPIASDVIYLGGGLAIPHLAGGHSPGGNVMVGGDWQRPHALSPFVEAKWVLFSVYTSFNLLTGVTVGF